MTEVRSAQSAALAEAINAALTTVFERASQGLLTAQFDVSQMDPDTAFTLKVRFEQAGYEARFKPDAKQLLLLLSWVPETANKE